MKNKYLLYIDMLGFSELVQNKPEEVRRLYRIIENLNCHRHDLFKVIVFPDTLLVYNNEDPFFDREHKYIVMFLIEFAQDLLYNTIGKNFFFRGVLVHGEFEHLRPNNVERFFGKALIKAYLSEKDIPCTGLFIDSSCQQYNNIFPVEKYNDEFSFVYLNQSLDTLLSGELGDIPIDGGILFQTDSQWNLAKDIIFLSSIYKLMRTHLNPNVRQKFLMTWDYYSKRYGKITEILKNCDFDPKCISPNFDWREASRRVLEGYRASFNDPPTLTELKTVIESARSAGKDAVKNECIKRFGEEQPRSDRYFLPCGGAFIILDIAPACRLGRFLLKNVDKLERASISKDHKKRGLVLSIHDMHSRQEMAIDEVAANAALMVVRDRLDVDGFVETYVD